LLLDPDDFILMNHIGNSNILEPDFSTVSGPEPNPTYTPKEQTCGNSLVYSNKFYHCRHIEDFLLGDVTDRR
jgi:hypothetical protein